MERGEFTFHIGSLGCANSTMLLGRFCQGDSDLTAKVRALQSEERASADVMEAELVHVPIGRAANVLARPVFADFELWYLGRGGAEPAKVLTLDDLWVSVRAGRVVFFAESRQQEVRVHLTCAHSAFQPTLLPTYRFLYAVALQGLDVAFAWDWGSLANLPYLPRVTWGRCVLSLERWIIPGLALQATWDAHRRCTQEGLHRLRAQYKLPRFVTVVEGDNELPVDLETPGVADAVLSAYARRTWVHLRELYPAPEDLVVECGAERFTHEVFLPLRRVAPDDARLERHAVPAAQLSFPLGSEWTYLKLYLAPLEGDDTLTQIIAPCMQRWREAGTVDRWFFIRFADPSFHIRLRWRSPGRHGHTAVLADVLSVLRPLLMNGQIQRTSLETYHPEIERYGGREMFDACEEYFDYDSAAVAAVLSALAGQPSDDRLIAGIYGIDDLLRACAFSLNRRCGLTERIADDATKRLVSDKGTLSTLRRNDGRRFRDLRLRISRVLSEGGLVFDQGLCRLFGGMPEPLATRLQEGLAALEKRRSADDALNVVGSLIHMRINRLLLTPHVETERLMHELLARHYKSTVARSGASRAQAR